MENQVSELNFPGKMLSGLCSIAFLAFVILFVQVVEAGTFDDAQAAYVEGRFIEAAEIAEAIDTSEAYALASKSLRIHARYEADADQREALHGRAIDLANLSIQANSENADAYLQLSRAMGRHSHAIGKFQAMRKKYAKKSLEAIETAISLDPELASAHVSLGRWHVGIVARIGSFLARSTFGATKKEAIASFDRALELKPESNVDYLNIAEGLEALGKKKYRKQIVELVGQAISMPVTNAYDKIIHQKAVDFLADFNASKS